MAEEPKAQLAVIIMARNEAAMIADCIESVKVLGPAEILVIDDNSTDETAQIATFKGARVVKHQKRNFADARNFGRDQTTADWIAYIDADERMSSQLRESIKNTIQSKNAVGAYALHRVNFYLQKRWPKTELLARLFRRTALRGWRGEVHETADYDGRLEPLHGDSLHYTHNSLESMIQNTLMWSKIEAELRFQAHHPPVVWWRLPRVMILVFFNYLLVQGGWRVGTVGLIEAIYQSFSIFITYARLWELQQTAATNNQTSNSK